MPLYFKGLSLRLRCKAVCTESSLPHSNWTLLTDSHMMHDTWLHDTPTYLSIVCVQRSRCLSKSICQLYAHLCVFLRITLWSSAAVSMDSLYRPHIYSSNEATGNGVDSSPSCLQDHRCTLYGNWKRYLQLDERNSSILTLSLKKVS